MVIGNPQKKTNWGHKLLSWVGYLGDPRLVSAFTTSAVVLGLRAIGSLQGLELALYDQMIRLRPALPPDERILVVGIDEADIQTRGEWPIADKTLAELLEGLQAGEPRAIGLDIFRDVPIGDGQASLLERIQSDERVVTVCKISNVDTPGVPPPEGTPEFQVGFSDLVVDSGGILRRNLLIAQPPEDSNTATVHTCNRPDAQLFSLGFQLALRYLTAEGVIPEITSTQELRLQDTVLSRLGSNMGGYHNVDAMGYQLLLDFRAARNAVPVVSMTDVLSGQVSPEQIRDRVVLIGFTTPEAKDTFYTPYSGAQRDSQKMPGVIVHAQSVSQILGITLDGQPVLWSWTDLVEGLWIIGWGIGGALFAGYVKRPIRFTLGIVVLLSSLYGACYVLFLQGGWVPLVPPALVLTLAAGVVVLLDRFNESDYGQAVYQQMKNLLRLDIEIDETIVGQQVSEITETEYFNTLQQQAQQMRQRRQQQNLAGEEPTERRADTSEPSTAEDDMDDFLKNVKQVQQRWKSSEPDDDAP